MAHKILEEIIGKNIARYREAAGLTQATLAEKIGISTAFVSRVGLLTKCLMKIRSRQWDNKKDARWRHFMFHIMRFRFKAVAERRQWSSAASKPRRKRRVKLCIRF